MAFRFIHTADIHLDSPLRSLSLRDPEIAELIGNATRQSFAKIVDLCLDEAVDALMIAGDLYDNKLGSMKTAAFLRSEMRRLKGAGIPVFIIRGNHDAESVITRHLSLPDNVHVFSGRAEAVAIEGRDVVVHGVSFAKRHMADSLLPKYKQPVAGAVNIGLLHTSLGGSVDHDVYAPCALADLTGHGYDYWGLGHIHKRAAHAEGPATVVMPGIPQGRHINEAGPKSVTLVEIADDRTVSVSERFTAIAQFERVPVDVAGIETWPAVLRKVEMELGSASDAALSNSLVARLELTGLTPLAFRLRRDVDELISETREAAADGVFIEAIDMQAQSTAAADRTGADGTGAEGAGSDPFAELRLLMDTHGRGLDAVRKAARELVVDLQQHLPVDARARLGDSDEDVAAMVETFMREGAETLLARFEADRADN